jgi:hypothetical protein
LSLYAELYEIAVDQTRQRPLIEARLALVRAGQTARVGEPKLMELPDRVAVFDTIGLKGLQPGPYLLEIRMHDRVSGQRLIRRVPFKIVA